MRLLQPALRLDLEHARRLLDHPSAPHAGQNLLFAQGPGPQADTRSVQKSSTFFLNGV